MIPRAARKPLAILVAALALVVVVPVLGAGGFLLWLRQQTPAYEGAAAVLGIEGPVEILRDRNAIPHIFAATERDAYFALGYVHAQDRLWQMETMRRSGAGRLAELVGTRFGDWALRLDRSMRTLGVYRRAEEAYEELSPEARTAFDAYAAGVNAWMETRREALPIEFQLLRHTPEPWRPADSLVWGKLMALQLSGDSRDELFRASALRSLTPEQMRDLFPDSDPTAPVTLAAALDGMDLPKALAALPDLGFDTASNEWALTGARSATGKPIIANDPHLGLEAPILWYLARIVTPDHRIAGATIPGVPLHILGHNGRVAWGFTTTHSDTQDLFIEKLDPQDPDRYLTPDGGAAFETRQETIRIAGQPDEALTVRETRHGPVLTTPDAASATPEGHVLALAFPGLSDADTTAEALYRLNHAADAATVREALFLHVAPQQNVVYADTAGTLGFLSPALVPVRRGGDGRVPVPGWTGEHDWIGYIPFDALPQAVDPPSGQFVNANNAVVGPGYPYALATEWPDPARAERIVQMLSDGPHTVEEVAAQQMDELSLPARDLLPLMLEPLRGVPDFNGQARAALDRLAGWDGRMDRDRAEPLIFSWWERELVRSVFADELGPLFQGYWDLRPRALHRVLTQAPQWCDDRTTPAREDCTVMLAGALKSALAEIERRHGTDMNGWRWGAEHKAALNHRLLGRVPLLGQMFDLSLPTGGGAFTVNRGTTRVRDPQDPFSHIHGPGLRAVYDLADLGNSRFSIATGQSGNPLSPHWGDLVQGWRDGLGLRLAGDRGTLARDGATLLTLSPIRPGSPQ